MVQLESKRIEGGSKRRLAAPVAPIASQPNRLLERGKGDLERRDFTHAPPTYQPKALSLEYCSFPFGRRVEHAVDIWGNLWYGRFW